MSNLNDLIRKANDASYWYWAAIMSSVLLMIIGSSITSYQTSKGVLVASFIYLLAAGTQLARLQYIERKITQAETTSDRG